MEFQYEKNRIYYTDANGKLLAEIAFSEQPGGVVAILHTFVAVSYTHLEVYKRQPITRPLPPWPTGSSIFVTAPYRIWNKTRTRFPWKGSNGRCV